MAWFLALQGPTHRTNELTVYQLAESANIERLEQELLHAAAIGGVVAMPAVFAQQQKPVKLYIRPAAWGLWTFYELSNEEQIQQRVRFEQALAQAMRQQRTTSSVGRA